MFKKPKVKNELEPPPLAHLDPNATEVLRVWTSPSGDGPVEVALNTTWKDPALWGILLVDVARHAAKAYGMAGHEVQMALDRIKLLFDAEWENPTDTPKNLTPRS